MQNNPTETPARNQRPLTVEETKAFLSGKIGLKQMRKDHGYSSVVAEQYGIPAALVLKYLEFRISKSSVAADGRQWHCESLADIARHYPYLSASSIHAALRSVPETRLSRRKIRSRKTRAFTSIYAFADQEFQTQVKSALIYFSPQHASDFGLHEAVVIHHLEHRFRLKRRKNAEFRFLSVSPTELAERLKISRASISRAINVLVEAGVLEKKPERSARFPEYSFSQAHEPVCA